jgi:RHS repeat-associated protein
LPLCIASLEEGSQGDRNCLLHQYALIAGTAYGYDDNGNLAFDGQFRYYYDCESRLTDINDANDAPVASYAYDYLGRRSSRTIYGAPNIIIKYAYDGDRIIAEYDGSGTLLRKFIYGPGIDEPICLVEVAENNAVYYYHFDGLGSVVALSDVNSVLVERYTYDVFGRPAIRDANGTEIAASAFANPYLFTGRAYDAETGLYYYRARYYDFATGRFLQPDSTGYIDGLNLYAYVANSPMNWVDPSGHAITRIVGPRGGEVGPVYNQARQIPEGRTVVDFLNDPDTLPVQIVADDSCLFRTQFVPVRVPKQISPGNYGWGPGAIICWNPTMGCITFRGHLESPATLLMHESIHTYRFGKYGMFDSEWDVELWEHPFAQLFGDDLRETWEWEFGFPYPTVSPTSTQPDWARIEGWIWNWVDPTMQLRLFLFPWELQCKGSKS